MPTVYTGNTEGGPPINAIIFANAAAAAAHPPDSQALMTKIKVCRISPVHSLPSLPLFPRAALYNRVFLRDLRDPPSLVFRFTLPPPAPPPLPKKNLCLSPDGFSGI